MSTHIMLDIETLGLQPGAAIVSIGAVVFYNDRWVDLTDPGSNEGCYIEISAASCLRAGMFIDPKTLDWWRQQSDYARRLIERVHDQPGGQPINEALDSLTRFIHGFSEPCIWGNGSDFDNVLVREAYQMAKGLPAPWSHRNNRCYRTIRSLRPDIPFVETPGTLHHSWFDALDQARHAQQLLYNLGMAGHGSCT